MKTSRPSWSFSVRCPLRTANLLVFAQPWKSDTDPGSVASTSRTSPACIPSTSFFARTIGTGHLVPRTSSRLVSIGRTPRHTHEERRSGHHRHGAGGALVLAELPLRRLVRLDRDQTQVGADDLGV